MQREISSALNKLHKKKFEDKKNTNTDFQKLNQMLSDYNKQVFEKEYFTYVQKKAIAERTNKINKLTDYLISLNLTNNTLSQSEYLQLKKTIKRLFDELKEQPSSINDFFGFIHLMKSKKDEVLHVAKIVKESKTNQDNITKNNKSLNKKVSKLSKKDLKTTTNPFPFKSLPECRTKAISSPTFVRKNELVQILEKLNYQSKVGKPLTEYTKDELCAIYFEKM